MQIDWTKNKEIEGSREQIIAQVDEIIAGWGLVMPREVILVLDFGLGDFPRYGLVEFWVANEEKQGYCGKYLFLFENQTCPAHHHKIKHETFFVVKGRVRMNANEKEVVMKEGDVFAMNQGVTHSFTAEGGPALILEASKPCVPQDSIFEDERIGEI